MIAGRQVKLIQAYNENIREWEKQVEAVTGQLPCYQYIQQLPGIGRILGLTISMETGPIARFPEDGRYASYCRCMPTDRESNGKSKGENNGKCGNQYLAWAYIEAAHFARRYDPPSQRFYEHTKAKTNPMVATKALARKLSKAGWHVMSQNEPYDPQRVFPFLRQPAAQKAN